MSKLFLKSICYLYVLFNYRDNAQIFLHKLISATVTHFAKHTNIKAVLELPTWNISEDLDGLMHCFVSVVYILLDGLCINRHQWIVHPTLVPAQPIRSRYPKVTEWLKVFDKLVQFIILR
jgi:hypothetical protein